MKNWKKFLTSVLTAGLLTAVSVSGVAAAPQEEYTYTVRFYSGNQGVFDGTTGLSVESDADYNVSGSDSEVVVSGLQAGDVVSFDAQGGTVSLDADSKYYVKGVRVSGRDNNTVEASSFHVTEDRDYVVAYGIKGDITNYTVNYHDVNGNELAPSRTYYGNIGDKPVVAHLYVENYTPQALALTKTLSSNEADNVFTFTYSEVEPEVITQPGETTTTVVTETVDGTDTTGTTGTGTGVGTVVAGEGTGTTGAGTGTTGEGTGTGTTGEGAGAGTDTAGEGTDTTGEGTEAGTDAAGEEIAPEDVPQGQQDLVDLDDEETPLGEQKLDTEEVKKGLPLAAGIAMGAAAVAALVCLVIFIRKRSR